ncbi:MAG: hypothetical protein Q4F24_08170 [Eubacteriales bacterium]|nr:hypothetical protein [Eubacteriales bacterium]
MMEIPMMSGGDAVDYDRLTASTRHVRAGDIFLGTGSEEEQVGDLPDMSNPNGSACLKDTEIPVHYPDDIRVAMDSNGENKIAFSPPRGDYPGGTDAYIGILPKDIGIDPSIIANGHSICEVMGDYGRDGDAMAGDIREGVVGYNKDGRVPGGARDYGNVNMTIQAGSKYEIGSGFHENICITASDLASQTKGDAAASDLAYGKKATVNGKVVTGNQPVIPAIDPAKSVVQFDNILFARISPGIHRDKATSGYPEVSIPRATALNAMGIINRGQAQYGGIGAGTDYYAINGLPEGLYQKNGAAWAPEARCSKNTVRNYLGVEASKIVYGQVIAEVNGNRKTADYVGDTLFDKDFYFAGTSYSYLDSGGDNYRIDGGTWIANDKYAGYILLQFGINYNGYYDTVPVWYPIGTNSSRRFMLACKNTLYSTVGLVISRNRNGDIYIKGLNGYHSGTYRLKIVRVLRCNQTCTVWD